MKLCGGCEKTSCFWRHPDPPHIRYAVDGRIHPVDHECSLEGQGGEVQGKEADHGRL